MGLDVIGVVVAAVVGHLAAVPAMRLDVFLLVLTLFLQILALFLRHDVPPLESFPRVAVLPYQTGNRTEIFPRSLHSCVTGLRCSPG